MNKSIIAIAAALVLSTVFAAAQTPPQTGTGVGARGGLGKGHKGGPNAPVMKQLNEAIRLMNNALPIYDGKRADADNLTRLARKEVVNATKGGNDKFKKLNDKDDPKKYTAEQIEASQKRMREALGHEEQALKLIGTKGSGNGNELGEAADDVTKAIELIKKCIGEFNGH